jgi:CheY-like chemotaxis protein
MTADMTFEGLIVSRDAGIFRVMDRTLRQLSISTSVCLGGSKARNHLTQHRTDLLVIDCDMNDWTEVMDEVWKSTRSKKPTVVAISRTQTRVTGAHVMVKKPITDEGAAQSLKAAYHRMLHDYRRHARHAIMMPVVATDDKQRSVPVMITDIGEGGLGVSTKEQLSIGQELRLRLKLPRLHREILLEVRVLWMREYGRAGCEFVRIPPVDATVLNEWLKSRIRVKKPLVDVV